MAGVLFTFLPEEVAGRLHANPDGAAVPIYQLLGAVYLGFAGLNWLSRRSKIGGMYGRPVVVANFAHAFVAVFAVGRLARLSGMTIPWMATVVYGIFAATFAFRLFRKA
ncbi:hypothetical protein [Neolewinella xylanilytica]|uniref:hypothetical protein n=1 Tax=Neolewinella xylanilytica TaxID=1514080 RepID=UPI000CEAD51B|nr:hypothetical protein [Neolewinella xylanilytica]